MTEFSLTAKNLVYEYESIAIKYTLLTAGQQVSIAVLLYLPALTVLLQVLKYCTYHTEIRSKGVSHQVQKWNFYYKKTYQ